MQFGKKSFKNWGEVRQSRKRVRNRKKPSPVISGQGQEELEPTLQKYLAVCRKCDVCNLFFPGAEEALKCLHTHGLKRCFACFQSVKIDLETVHYKQYHGAPDYHNSTDGVIVPCPFCALPQGVSPGENKLQEHILQTHSEGELISAIISGNIGKVLPQKQPVKHQEPASLDVERKKYVIFKGKNESAEKTEPSRVHITAPLATMYDMVPGDASTCDESDTDVPVMLHIQEVLVEEEIDMECITINDSDDEFETITIKTETDDPLRFTPDNEGEVTHTRSSSPIDSDSGVGSNAHSPQSSSKRARLDSDESVTSIRSATPPTLIPESSAVDRDGEEEDDDEGRLQIVENDEDNTDSTINEGLGHEQYVLSNRTGQDSPERRDSPVVQEPTQARDTSPTNDIPVSVIVSSATLKSADVGKGVRIEESVYSDISDTEEDGTGVSSIHLTVGVTAAGSMTTTLSQPSIQSATTTMWYSKANTSGMNYNDTVLKDSSSENRSATNGRLAGTTIGKIVDEMYQQHPQINELTISAAPVRSNVPVVRAVSVISPPRSSSAAVNPTQSYHTTKPMPNFPKFTIVTSCPNPNPVPNNHLGSQNKPNVTIETSQRFSHLQSSQQVGNQQSTLSFQLRDLLKHTPYIPSQSQIPNHPLSKPAVQPSPATTNTNARDSALARNTTPPNSQRKVLNTSGVELTREIHWERRTALPPPNAVVQTSGIISHSYKQGFLPSNATQSDHPKPTSFVPYRLPPPYPSAGRVPNGTTTYQIPPTPTYPRHPTPSPFRFNTGQSATGSQMSARYFVPILSKDAANYAALQALHQTYELKIGYANNATKTTNYNNNSYSQQISSRNVQTQIKAEEHNRPKQPLSLLKEVRAISQAGVGNQLSLSPRIQSIFQPIPNQSPSQKLTPFRSILTPTMMSTTAPTVQPHHYTNPTSSYAFHNNNARSVPPATRYPSVESRPQGGLVPSTLQTSQRLSGPHPRSQQQSFQTQRVPRVTAQRVPPQVPYENAVGDLLNHQQRQIRISAPLIRSSVTPHQQQQQRNGQSFSNSPEKPQPSLMATFIYLCNFCEAPFNISSSDFRPLFEKHLEQVHGMGPKTFMPPNQPQRPTVHPQVISKDNRGNNAEANCSIQNGGLASDFQKMNGATNSYTRGNVGHFGEKSTGIINAILATSNNNNRGPTLEGMLDRRHL